jgi:hypothetical protein
MDLKPRALPPPTPSIRIPSEEQVTKSPGLSAYLVDAPEPEGQLDPLPSPAVSNPPATTVGQGVSSDLPPSAVKPTRLYGWNRPLPSDTQQAVPEEQSIASSNEMSSLSENAALQQALGKINSLATQLSKVKTTLDTSLVEMGEAVYGMRVKLHDQEIEINNLRALGAGGTASLFGGTSLPQTNLSLTPSDKQALAIEVMSMINMSQFSTKTEVTQRLVDYAKKADLTSLARRAELSDVVRASVLKDYITATQLGMKDFVDHAHFSSNMPAVPANLEDRLLDLEKDVLQPGGAFAIMQDTFKDMQAAAKRGGVSVTIRGYTFKDVVTTEAWANLLGSDIISYFLVDMRLQLSLISTRLKTSDKFIQEEADARKAGYASHTVAKAIASFHVTYPETIFQSSGKSADAGKGAMSFTAACSTAENFKGNLEYSSVDHMLDMLEQNRTQYQQAINARFPPDQAKHAKTHAIAAEILLQGYWQACGFLKSLVPFYEMMTGAGLKKDDAWSKCLTYARAVFEHIYEVRSTSADKTPGAMIHGMLRATQMLQSYMELGWIRHPDVSSALVVAALQMEGKAVEGALKKDKVKSDQINTNKDGMEKLAKQMKALKDKNPNLNW